MFFFVYFFSCMDSCAPLCLLACPSPPLFPHGSFTESAYHYIETSGGLVQDDDYPYTKKTYEGITGQCEVNTRLDVVSLTGFTQIQGETNMANYMLSTGPLSVCVAAEVWNTYRGGIMTTCPGGVDHCVQAVGVNTGVGGYWKVSVCRSAIK